MVYAISVDLVVAFHFLWIVFLIFGALAGRYFQWVKWVHISALAFSLLIQLLSWTCPLTHLELWLRARHDPSMTYTGSFIAKVLEQWVYLQVSQTAILIGTSMVILFSGWLYFGTNILRYFKNQQKNVEAPLAAPLLLFWRSLGQGKRCPYLTDQSLKVGGPNHRPPSNTTYPQVHPR